MGANTSLFSQALVGEDLFFPFILLFYLTILSTCLPHFGTKTTHAPHRLHPIYSGQFIFWLTIRRVKHDWRWWGSQASPVEWVGQKCPSTAPSSSSPVGLLGPLYYDLDPMQAGSGSGRACQKQKSAFFKLGIASLLIPARNNLTAEALFLNRKNCGWKKMDVPCLQHIVHIDAGD